MQRCAANYNNLFIPGIGSLTATYFNDPESYWIMKLIMRNESTTNVYLWKMYLEISPSTKFSKPTPDRFILALLAVTLPRIRFFFPLVLISIIVMNYFYLHRSNQHAMLSTDTQKTTLPTKTPIPESCIDMKVEYKFNMI